MRYLIAFLFCLDFFTVAAQSPPQKIRIVLLGSFHFHHTLDTNSKLHMDVFSARRQAEIDAVVGRLAAFKPTRIFVERVPAEQNRWDSLYRLFTRGIEPTEVRTRANEIVQLGFKTAKQVGLSGVTCVDFQPEIYKDSNFTSPYPTEKTVKQLWDDIDAYDDSVRTNARFFDARYPVRRPKSDSLLQVSTISQYLQYLNTPANYTYFTWSDWNYLYSMGRKDEYPGVDWLANFWYGRNLRIYANILREASLKQPETYLVIYGASHIPFLKHLFETNPFFEVVPVEAVLK